jgi:hypothetical protein
MKKAMTLTVLAAASLLATTAMAQDKGSGRCAGHGGDCRRHGCPRKNDGGGRRAVGGSEKPAGQHQGISRRQDIHHPCRAGMRNLAQIGPGSVVKVEYHEALALALEKVQGDGINVREDVVSAGRTPAGALPGATIEDNVKMIGTIIAINKEKRTVLIQGAIHHVSLKIPADMDFKDLKVGDQVMAHYVQELGVAVGPAPTPSLKMPKVGNE